MYVKFKMISGKRQKENHELIRPNKTSCDIKR